MVTVDHSLDNHRMPTLGIEILPAELTGGIYRDMESADDAGQLWYTVILFKSLYSVEENISPRNANELGCKSGHQHLTNVLHHLTYSGTGDSEDFPNGPVFT
ncbi:hypothetical protein GDO81_026049 [Engystomops pustulosus]|uniref:Uncharacterized protein n=1 Tax=Engystomops pustulosus TaxID=76066 RepID=A0AAV6YLS3_ENGPU|nr:hypothetical protein GDO81_026049 [Engystomops pustulosus]